MTNLHDINLGINQYCGPAVLSALTGESTDTCAAVISAVSGNKTIKAVHTAHLLEALRRLGFKTTDTNLIGSTLYGTLFKMHNKDGFYVVLLPEHFIALEIQGDRIYLCDNHSKKPIDIRQSARLTQKVSRVYRVERNIVINPSTPKFIKNEIRVTNVKDKIYVFRDKIYEGYYNPPDTLGSFTYSSKAELHEIVEKLQRITSEHD